MKRGHRPRLTRAILLALVVPFLGPGCGKGTREGASSGGASAGSRWNEGPRAAAEPVDTTLARRGETLFKSKTCSTCHAFGLRITGPDLQGVTRRRTSAWIERQILHPDLMTKEDPIARGLLGEYAVQMPNLLLKPEEARALLEFLKRKDRE
jgi:cytochrome c551/c552